jgi:hypothetical protein
MIAVHGTDDYYYKNNMKHVKCMMWGKEFSDKSWKEESNQKLLKG